MTGHGKLISATINGQPVWAFSLAPHVMIRFRRMFPRAFPYQRGKVALRDTLEVCRDLEWFLDRYPLEVGEGDLTRLLHRAEAHRREEEEVADILSGHTPVDEWREPARPPRKYQWDGAHIIYRVRRTLIGDDLGLGKTTTGLLTLRDPEALPGLVVCPTHLPAQWLRELETVLPWLNGHIVTSATPYDPATRHAGHTPDVLIMSYSKLANWGDHLAGNVGAVIFDECQELRTGANSNKGRAAAVVADKARYVVGLTATPVFNYGGEIHNIYEIIAPDVLGTRAEFLREWGSGESVDSFGNNKRIKVRDPRALGTYLREQHVLVRRTRADVHRELPEPLRIRQEIDTDQQLVDAAARDVESLARALLADNTPREDRFRAAGEIDWRMRRATGVAKAGYVAAFVKLLLESEQKVVLFGWHHDVYETWMRDLADYWPAMYTGQESPAQKARNAEAFTDGDARVLIMSLRSGVGLDGLQKAASVAVFGELDWSPAMHDQCIGRLDRDGQLSTVAAYFLVSDAGTDPPMEEVLGLKREQAEGIRNPDADLMRPAQTDIDRARRLAAAVLERRSGQGGAA